jgi:hypothetical protein
MVGLRAGMVMGVTEAQRRSWVRVPLVERRVEV